MPLDVAHSRDKGRNRDERRTVAVFDPADKLAGTDWHPHVAAIIRVELSGDMQNPSSGDTRNPATLPSRGEMECMTR